MIFHILSKFYCNFASLKTNKRQFIVKRKHLLNCNIAGFTYYEGPIVFKQLEVGTALHLVSEQENRYDPNAIALYFGKDKLGFIPRNDNKTLSLFFEQGYGDIFEVYINRITPDEYPENQIGVVVYLKEKKYKEKLPEKYQDIVRRIVEGISMNCVCYFNPDTLEMEDVSKDLLDEISFEDFEEDDDNEDDSEDEEDNDEKRDEESPENESGLTYMKWDKCIKIEPLESHESYEIMEKFLNQLKPGKETDRLLQAISGRKPFANFNHQIHNSKYREDWFAFRQKELEKHVIDNYFYEYLE
jgi:hypothetical protein